MSKNVVNEGLATAKLYQIAFIAATMQDTSNMEPAEERFVRYKEIYESKHVCVTKDNFAADKYLFYYGW